MRQPSSRWWGTQCTDSLWTVRRQEARVECATLVCCKVDQAKARSVNSTRSPQNYPFHLQCNAAARSKKQKTTPTFLRIFLGELGSPPRCWLTGGSRDQPHSCFSSFQSLHRCQTDVYKEHSCRQQRRVSLLPTLACLTERHPVQMCPSKGSSAQGVLALSCASSLYFANAASKSARRSLCCSRSGNCCQPRASLAVRWHTRMAGQCCWAASPPGILCGLVDCPLGFPGLCCSLDRQLLAQLLVTHICSAGSLHAWQPGGQRMAALAMPCILLKPQ